MTTTALGGRIMRLRKANFAGLTSPLQQAEMKSILAGTWPPLKPLPVFKYETFEYRATIEFDKKRGEWVCRKTSLPSNKLQELRGGLREITMALPHGDAQIFTEAAEQQEQELEKDANRRLQAIHEWRENYENGALYFELRDYLSESQRIEMDDSLRLSLTARQLQFNAKNVAYVFDALSTAGGRFARFTEFAKRNKAKQATDPQALGEGAEFPDVSIKDVLPEQEQASFAKQTAHAAAQPFEIETAEVAEADSPSLIAHPHQEARHSPAVAGFAAQVRSDPSSADRTEGLSSGFPALEISAFQVTLFALTSLFAVIAFAVGLKVGRAALGRHLREVSKSFVAIDAKSQTPSHQADKSTSQTQAPPVASSSDSPSTHGLDDATPSEGKSKENTRRSEYFAQLRSTDSDSSPTTESKPSVKLGVNSEHRGAIGLIAPRSPAPHRLAPAMAAAPHLPRSSAILVTLPRGRSQPFRVSLPEKAIAATSSFAMTSQLSVLVSPEPGPPLAYKPARLESGELVSFVWPRYPRSRNRYGRAETIRVRTTIGQLGQVLGVKFLSGSVSLFPATVRAIRQWRYRPTLLDKRPLEAQQDVTIEFRPPQYSSQVSTRQPSHN